MENNFSFIHSVILENPSMSGLFLIFILFILFFAFNTFIKPLFKYYIQKRKIDKYSTTKAPKTDKISFFDECFFDKKGIAYCIKCQNKVEIISVTVSPSLLQSYSEIQYVHENHVPFKNLTQNEINKYLQQKIISYYDCERCCLHNNLKARMPYIESHSPTAYYPINIFEVIQIIEADFKFSFINKFLKNIKKKHNYKNNQHLLTRNIIKNIKNSISKEHETTNSNLSEASN